MCRTVALLGLAVCVIARTASADPVPLIVHDFDDRPPGLQVYNEQDLSLFTYFAGTVATGVDIAASPLAPSPPNVVRGFVPGSGVLGRFLSTDGPQLTLATHVLFMDITGPADATWRVSIFDRDGSLIRSAPGVNPEGLGFRLRDEPGIASFLFEPGVPSQALDNIRYEPAVVPEPTTIVLVVSGLIGVARRRRHRSAARLVG